ncbi:MAG: ABC transporter ATP-binding protein [Chitinophagaceae bacterium]
MGLLQVNNICKKERDKLVVNNVSLSINVQQKIAIAGVTGSGKTTLLKMIAGFIQPDYGEILFEGKRVLGPFEQLLPGHPKIAYLSQHFELLNNYRVDTLLERSNKLANDEAYKIYSICKIEHLLKRKTHELSGGEKQRIALALELTKKPQLLILDEPFSNLDFIHKNIIKNVIEDAYNKLQFACIMVSHDAADILSWADEILIMQDGGVIQKGTPKQLYYHPANEYSAGILGAYNVLNLDSNLMRLNNNQQIIRQEQIVIKTTADNSFKATVTNVIFWGSYYTVNVFTDNQHLTIKTNHTNINVGDTISIGISK